MDTLPNTGAALPVTDAMTYVTKRGISLETCARLGILLPTAQELMNAGDGFYEQMVRIEGRDVIDTSRAAAGAVLFPLTQYDNGQPCYTARNPIAVSKKERWLNQKGATQGGFNLAALEREGLCIIAEGGFDALALEEAAAALHCEDAGAVSLSCADNASKAFAEHVEVLKKTGRLKASLIMWPDGDGAGRRAAKAMRRAMAALGVPFTVIETASPYKDASEFLEKDREGFLNAVSAIVSRYREGKIYIDPAWEVRRDYFNELIAKMGGKPIRTGMKFIDCITGRGLTDGLWILAAGTSCGKTALSMQIADYAAKHGNRVMVVHYEMDKATIMARSVSRQAFENNLLNTDPSHNVTAHEILYGRDKLSETQREALDMAVSDYFDGKSRAGKVYGAIYDGVSGRLNIVEVKEGMTARELRGLLSTMPEEVRPQLLVIDFLQIMNKEDPRMSDKEHMDMTARTLKQISRDYGICVLALSSINRASYGQAAALAALKESGGLEYTADVVLYLENKATREAFRRIEAAKGGVGEPRETSAQLPDSVAAGEVEADDVAEEEPDSGKSSGRKKTPAKKGPTMDELIRAQEGPDGTGARRVELLVLKNRFGQKTQKPKQLEYFARYNYFKPVYFGRFRDAVRVMWSPHCPVLWFEIDKDRLKAAQADAGVGAAPEAGKPSAAWSFEPDPD